MKSELRKILVELYLTGHSIGDAGYPDPHKTDDSYINKAHGLILELFNKQLPDVYDVMKRATPPDDPRKVVQEAWERGINSCLADIKSRIE